jgi:hypothetical protein
MARKSQSTAMMQLQTIGYHSKDMKDKSWIIPAQISKGKR